jgi:DNA polymerase III subunit delta'
MDSDDRWPIVGHKNIIEYLENSLKAEKLAHAYVFVGPSNLGKALTAKYFIKSILCKDGTPCNKCKSCKEFEKGIYPDFYDIKVEDGKRNISIEQIREVMGKIKESSFSGNFKIILIEEAEKMNLAGFNSLLKSLEEPNRKTVFILITNNISTLPETVLSRSQVIKFHGVGSEEILKHLLFLGVNKEVAFEAIGFSNGKPGLAIEYSKNKKLVDGYKILVNNFLHLLNSPINEKFNYIDKLMGKKTFKEKADIAERVIDSWLLVLRDLLLTKNSYFNSISHVFALDRIKVVSNNYSNKEIVKIIDRASEAKINLKKNVNPQLIIENLSLSF